MSDGDQVREQPYTARPSLLRAPGERIPAWQCACPGLKPWQRHAEPWLCVTARDIAAWRTRHPEATCRERVARPLAWLEATFGRR